MNGEVARATLRHRVHSLLDGPEPTPFALAVRIALAVLIVANVAAIAAETVPTMPATWQPWFRAFEHASLAVFSAEYLLRAFAAPEQPAYRGRLGRLRWVASPWALLDLAAVLPGLLVLTGVDLRFLRVVRLSRLLRIAKLSRYSLAAQTLVAVLRGKAADLLSLLFLLVVLLVLSSTLMYHLEHEAQPQLFSSIPATMWWGIVTLTTIGYGDMTPVTAGGRVLGGLIAILGIGMFALPAGLLGAAFVDELGKARQRRHGHDGPHEGSGDGTDGGTDGGEACPHCGRALPKG